MLIFLRIVVPFFSCISFADVTTAYAPDVDIDAPLPADVTALSTYCLVAAPRLFDGFAARIRAPVNVPPESYRYRASACVYDCFVAT